MTSKTGLSPDLVADMFGYPSGDALVRAVLAAEPMGSVIEGITDQRMLERHGELATPEALEAAANEAVHNEARARSLATELKSQSEMMNERSDTGRTNAAGRPITVNTIVEAAKQFALNLVARRRVNDLKSAAWQHRAAEARAGKAWQEATSKGETAKAVQAKRDQLLNNYAAKALQEAEAEVRKIGEFFKRVTTGNNEKVVKGGRDPDVINAMRAILAAYGVAPRLGKTALEYMEAVSRNDPAMYAALKPSVDGAMMAARPLG
jgi:murein L,D-transpeptidase YcbB/YkuD